MSEKIQHSSHNVGQMAVDNEQYLTFILAGEEYGIDILRVQEIKGWDTVTEIPNTPNYMLGVINLRGMIVPIVDLRKRFQLESAEYGKTTVVVVLKINSRTGEKTMGFVVDAVSEVYSVAKDQLKSSPDFGCAVSLEFVKGLVAIDEKMIILLDIDQLVEADRLSEGGRLVH